MAVDPSELTEECRAFLDAWGYLASQGNTGQFPSIATQIVPVISLGGRSGQGSGALQPWLDLSGEKFFTAFATEGATAAEFSAIHLLNPAGSGVDGYLLYANHDRHGDYSFSATALANAVVEASKEAGASAGRITVTTGTLVAAATALWRSPVVSTSDVHRDNFSLNPWKIPPGQGLLISGISANQAIQFSISWSEVAI